eukprot:m51a1_g2647 putative ste ste20 mst protein kinase (699) ;mRNA; f:612672-615775
MSDDQAASDTRPDDADSTGSVVSFADESVDPTEIYQLIGQLGEGAYGSVWHARRRETDEEYAVKVLQIETDFEDVRREIEFMKSAAHPNVCQYFGSYYRDPDLWIVMEYCAGGSCADMMRVCRRPFNEQMISAVIRDTLRGLSYIHSLRKIHRDIKAGNILVNSKGEAKIADFGVSGELTGTMSRMNTVIGSPFWMAPEIIMEVGYSSKVDIWSLGITCVELAETLPPLAEIHPMRAIFLIPSRPPPTFTDPSMWSPAFNSFVTRCLQKDPALRASADDLLTDPFIANSSSSTCLLRMLEEQAQVIKQLGRAEALGLGEEFIEDSIATQSRAALIESSVDSYYAPDSKQPSPMMGRDDTVQPSGVPASPLMSVNAGDSMVIKTPLLQANACDSMVVKNVPQVPQRESMLVRQRKRRTVAFASPTVFLSKRESVHYERVMMQQMMQAQAAQAQQGVIEKLVQERTIRAFSSPVPPAPNLIPAASASPPTDVVLSLKQARAQETPAAPAVATATPKQPQEKPAVALTPKTPLLDRTAATAIALTPKQSPVRQEKPRQDSPKLVRQTSNNVIDHTPKNSADLSIIMQHTIEKLVAEKRLVEAELERLRSELECTHKEKDLLRRKFFGSLVLSIKLEGQLLGWTTSVTQTAADLWETVMAENVPEESWKEWIMRSLAPDYCASIDARRASSMPTIPLITTKP